MPLLSRRARPLLHVVDGKQHATADDHEQTKSGGSSPLSDVPKEVDYEDLTRDPDSGSSSSDEAEASKPVDTFKARPGFSKSKPTSKSTKTTKSISNGGAKEKDPAPEEDWMTQSQKSRNTQFKKRKTYGSSQRSEPSSNPFKKAKITSSAPSSSQDGFVKRGSTAQTKIQSSPATVQSTQDSFALPHTKIVPRLRADGLPSPDATDAMSPVGEWSSSPEPELEVVHLDGDDSTPREPCPVCSAPVSRSLRLEFEVEHCRGKRMNLRMQDKFCRLHKREEATQLWRQRGYPDIDWNDLPSRLKDIETHIDDLMSGKVRSSFRTDFEQSVQRNTTRTATKAWEADVDQACETGYYGPKGARVLSEYALKTFKTQLARLEKEDKSLVTASVAGGVAGFLQAVVVPELALALVMGDLKVGVEEAKAVLSESAALGSMLHPEDDERLAVRAPTPEKQYGAEE